MNRRLTRILIVIVGFVVGLAVILGFAVYSIVGIEMRRAETIGFYRDALELCYYSGKTPPADILDLVAVYSPELATYTSTHHDLKDALPDYRPPERLNDGPYLVIVERSSQKWYYRGTYVVYAYPNGKPAETSKGGIKYARSAEELRSWLAEDDRLRAANGTTSLPASSTPSAR
jgi:hypothetical protein